jgi:hypothetical protein
MLVSAVKGLELKRKRIRHSLKSTAWTVLCRCSSLIGISPFLIYHIFRFGRKSGWINHLRKKRGLSKLD